MDQDRENDSAAKEFEDFTDGAQDEPEDEFGDFLTTPVTSDDEGAPTAGKPDSEGTSAGDVSDFEFEFEFEFLQPDWDADTRSKSERDDLKAFYLEAANVLHIEATEEELQREIDACMWAPATVDETPVSEAVKLLGLVESVGAFVAGSHVQLCDICGYAETGLISAPLEHKSGRKLCRECHVYEDMEAYRHEFVAAWLPSYSRIAVSQISKYIALTASRHFSFLIWNSTDTERHVLTRDQIARRTAFQRKLGPGQETSDDIKIFEAVCNAITPIAADLQKGISEGLRLFKTNDLSELLAQINIMSTANRDIFNAGFRLIPKTIAPERLERDGDGAWLPTSFFKEVEWEMEADIAPVLSVVKSPQSASSREAEVTPKPPVKEAEKPFMMAVMPTDRLQELPLKSSEAIIKAIVPSDFFSASMQQYSRIELQTGATDAPVEAYVAPEDHFQFEISADIWDSPEDGPAKPRKRSLIASIFNLWRKDND